MIDGRASKRTRRWRSSLLTCVVGSIAATGAAAGQDVVPSSAHLTVGPSDDLEDLYTWTRFRGPNGNGRLPEWGLPARLDPVKDQLWRTPLPPGHSSPVLFEGRVFLTALDGEALCTYCLDADDGEVHWRRVAPRPRKDPVDTRNHPASPTPTVGALGVFVFFPEYGVLGYDHTGEELWRVPLGPFVNDYGMGASPILMNGHVLLACDQARDSYLVALDARTGAERWRTPRPEARSGHCTPIVQLSFASRGNDISCEVFLPGSFRMKSYGLFTGQELWSAPGLSFEMKSVPVLTDEGLIVINGYGSPLNQPGSQITLPSFNEVLATNDADQDGALSEQEVPENKAKSWFPTVDLDRDRTLNAAEWVFFQDALASQNGLLAFDPARRGPDGAPTLVWAYRRTVPQLPSLVYDREVLYMLQDSGGLVVVLDPKTGEALRTVRIAGAVDTFYASPVASAEHLYIVSEHGLACVLPLYGEDPELTPRAITDLGEKVYATPALAPGRVYVRTTEALYCFHAGQ